MDEIKLIKEDESDYTQRIKYKYVMSSNSIENLLEKTNIMRKLSGLLPIKMDVSKSDLEFFKKLYPYRHYNGINNYYLVVNDIPVTLISSRERYNSDDIELAFSTNKRYLRRGYATMAVKLMEEELFKDDNVRYIVMVDVSAYGQTTKIANKLGYIQNENYEYYKKNPNYKKLVKKIG